MKKINANKVKQTILGIVKFESTAKLILDLAIYDPVLHRDEKRYKELLQDRSHVVSLIEQLKSISFTNTQKGKHGGTLTGEMNLL